MPVTGSASDARLLPAADVAKQAATNLGLADRMLPAAVGLLTFAASQPPADDMTSEEDPAIDRLRSELRLTHDLRVLTANLLQPRSSNED